MSSPQIAPFTAGDYREMPGDGRRRKRGLLAKAGTVEFWQIDPALRHIQRFVFAEIAAKPVTLIDEPETFTSPLFPGLILATAEIFRR